MTYLHHTTIEVNQGLVEETITFYGAVFGLHQIDSPVPMSAWFREGLHLYWGATAAQKPNGHPPARHVAFVLGKRFDEIVAILDKDYLGDATSYWGCRRGYAVDPSGNRVEIMETAPL